MFFSGTDSFAVTVLSLSLADCMCKHFFQFFGGLKKSQWTWVDSFVCLFIYDLVKIRGVRKEVMVE